MMMFVNWNLFYIASFLNHLLGNFRNDEDFLLSDVTGDSHHPFLSNDIAPHVLTSNTYAYNFKRADLQSLCDSLANTP